MRSFPFTALVGQESMKRGLIINAIDPTVGGILITGTRGTAKSTAVRSLAELLPDTPFVNLPVGSTEDRVLGTLDIERMLRVGEKHFEPGLLARANRGVLYVDEVNLLPDHLVDVLLDVVAMGVNRVEREGVSHEHEARVILVGTMNPEEGELRPQLLDRFGLCVEVEHTFDPAQRTEVVRRRIAFEADPEGFAAGYRSADEELARRIIAARDLLSQVVLPEESLAEIARRCAEAFVDGLRADIIIYKAARVLAAFDGRDTVEHRDIDEAAIYALAHRRREPPPPAPPPRGSRATNGQAPPQPQPQQPPVTENALHEASAQTSGSEHGAAPDSGDGGPQPSPAEPASPVVIGFPTGKEHRHARGLINGRAGKHASFLSTQSRGPFVRAILPPAQPFVVALQATIRAALADRGPVKPRHLRAKQYEARAQNLVVFIVDASGSMAGARLRAAKGAVCSLLAATYRSRDRLALIAFGGDTAEVLLPPTRSAAFAYRRLVTLPARGRTPLGAALSSARTLIERELRKDRLIRPYVVLVTDGRATLPVAQPLATALQEATALHKAGVAALCIDTETGYVRLRAMQRIATAMGATYTHVDEARTGSWAPAVSDWISAQQQRSA